MGQIVDRAIRQVWRGPKGAGLNLVDKLFTKSACIYLSVLTEIYAMEGFILLLLSIRQRNIIPGRLTF